MTTDEMLVELEHANVNFFIHYSCHSKRYRVTVPWLDEEQVDRKLDVALRLTLEKVKAGRGHNYGEPTGRGDQ